MIDAIKRYKRIIKQLLKQNIRNQKRASDSDLVEHPTPEFRNNPYFCGYLDEIKINLTNSCENARPNPQMQEDCEFLPYKYKFVCVCQ